MLKEGKIGGVRLDGDDTGIRESVGKENRREADIGSQIKNGMRSRLERLFIFLVDEDLLEDLDIGGTQTEAHAECGEACQVGER